MPRTLKLSSSVFLFVLASSALRADPPVASYIFPAGGQRGTTVPVRVGGLNLHSRCGFELLGSGVSAERELKRMPMLWFEGPILPLPESQQQEDYPKDMAGKIVIAADAPLGVRPGRLWTAQGAASGLAFVIGDLPEIVEKEADGPVASRTVTLPITINGRIYPREDVDDWTFSAKRGQMIVAEVLAGRLGSPLDPHLELLDRNGLRLAEDDPYPGRSDARITHTFTTDGTYRIRIRDTRSLGGPAFVYRLTVRTSTERDVAHAPPPTTPLLVPVDVRGRIAAPGHVDAWPVQMKKDTAYEIDLHAKRIDSPLRPVLTVRDAGGKELTRFDSVAQNGVEPIVRFMPPADGVYRIDVTERFKSRGGPAFNYRLTVAPASTQPDFRLTFAADTLNLARGGKAKLKIIAERRNGSKEPIELNLDGLPDGVNAAKTTLAANQSSIDIALDASADAPIGVARVSVRGSAKIGDKLETRVAHVPANKGLPEIDSLLLAVTLPTPFAIKADYLLTQAPRGTVFPRRYRIERNGYTGPLTVTLADRQARHLQGVTGPTLVVPADKNEFDYPITMPPWMETGRTCRACIMAVGVVKDKDGREHEVSFSSVEQNMQIIVVVEPGRLGLELERGSIRAEPGKAASLSFRVQRGEGLTGPAKVELLPVAGMTAEPVTIPANRSAGTLTIRFGNEVRSTVTTIRAIILDDGRPVTAEAKLEIIRLDR